ncbi:MAG: flagellar biosynthetic protein FliO [Desulfobacterota bacterium]|nr:flagellar biosynthetic protein FliO [Thermodesulfobacteriota bacterium]
MDIIGSQPWPMLVQMAGSSAEDAVQVNFFAAFVRIAAVLACVIGLLLVLATVLRKYNMLQRPLLGSQRTIRVLETAYIGPKQSLALVQAGHEIFLLGLTQQTITFLSRIDILGKDTIGAGTGNKQFSELLATELCDKHGVTPVEGGVRQKWVSWLGRTLGKFTARDLSS